MKTKWLFVLAFALGLLVAFAFWGEKEKVNASCVTSCYRVKRYYDNAYVCEYCNQCTNGCTQFVCDNIGVHYYTEPICGPPPPPTFTPTSTPTPTATPTPTPRPPVLTLDFLCASWGNAGWCRADGRIEVKALEPSGTNVEVGGNTGGPIPQQIKCGGIGSCSVVISVVEGAGTAWVFAHSIGGTVEGTLDWKYDPTAPTLSYTILPASPDGLSGWYVTAPVVTVQGSDATSGVAAEEVSLDSGNTWSSSPVTLSDGVHSLVFRVSDVAGNITTQSGPTVKVDATAPSLSVTAPSPDGRNGWFVTSPAILSVTASDATSGLSAVECRDGSGPWQDASSGRFSVSGDGVHDVTCRATDVAGHVTTQSTTVKIDTTPPDVTGSVDPAAPDGQNGWYVSHPTFSVAASDATSGLAATEVSTDGGSTWQDYTAPLSLSDGVYTLAARATNAAGNTATWNGPEVKVDAIAPSLSVTVPSPDGQNGWFVTSPVILSVTASDATSGLSAVECRDGSGPWQDASSGRFSVSSDGVHDVTCRATDVAGNTTTDSVTVRIDTTPPEAGWQAPSPDGQNGWFVTEPVAIDVIAQDNVSGMSDVHVSLDGSPVSLPASVAEDGVHTLTGYVVDVAGNRADLPALTVKIDTTPPNVAGSVDPAASDGQNGWYVTMPTFTVSVSDATSGLTATEASTDGGSTWQDYTAPFTLSNGVYTLAARAADVAGNTATWNGPEVKVDTIPPTVTVYDPGVLLCVSTIQGKVEDTGSGVAGAAWSADGTTWNPLDVRTDGAFAFQWDVRTFPAGRHELRFRVWDVAGNVVEASGTFAIAHPEIGIAFRPKGGYFWDVFDIRIAPDCMKVTRIRVVVENPDGPNAVLGDWDTTTWTEYRVQAKWSGFWPNRAARPGTYWLRVDVWDVSGRVSRDWAKVILPAFGPQRTPTPLPTATPTPTAMPTFTPTPTLATSVPAPTEATPVPIRVVTSSPTPAPVPSPTPALTPRPSTPPTPAKASLLLPAVIAAALGLLGLRDPRVPELERLRHLARRFRELNRHTWFGRDW